MALSSIMKQDTYIEIINKIKVTIPRDSDLISVLANVSAIINESFSFLWCGFYLVKDQFLVLGPFQGHAACLKIPFGRGVCGKSWQSQSTIIVKDVNTFDGYIACSSIAKSEIVVPVFRNGSVVAVIDIDSEFLATFDDMDAKFLSEISQIVGDFFN